MALRRIVVLVALLTALLASVLQPAARAQERGPLAMQIEFQWTVAGIGAGIAVGALLWLTDPGSPDNNLSDNMAGGAAYGAILGAAMGFAVMQRSAVFPPGFAVRNPLNPRNRISTDPVAGQSGEGFLMAHRPVFGSGGPRIQVPVLRVNF
jgi:hypothetical protein